MGTFGSMSTAIDGANLRKAAAFARQQLVARARDHLMVWMPPPAGIATCQGQTALILAALGLPFLGSIFDSKDTFCPSLSELNPERSTSEIWTKTSGPPPSTTMKPKPFCALKNFTVPVVIVLALSFVTQLRYGPLLTRLPATHAARLQLHALAYNLGNFLRTLAIADLGRQRPPPGLCFSNNTSGS